MTENTGLAKPSEIRAKADAMFQKVEASPAPEPTPQEAPQEPATEVTETDVEQVQEGDAPESSEAPQTETQAKPKTPYIPKPRVDQMVQKAREEATKELLPQLEQERAARLALQNYIQQFVQPKAPEQAPEEPLDDFLDDKLAKVVFDLKRRNEALEAKLGQVEQTTTADKTFNKMEQIEAAFAAQNPDYNQAVQHVIQLYPDQNLGAKTVWDIATTALKQNKNPAAELYAFAKKAGFASKAAELKNSPNLKAIEKNAARTRSVGDIQSDVPSTNAPAYDYGKLVGKHGLSDPKRIRELAKQVNSRAGNLV